MGASASADAAARSRWIGSSVAESTVSDGADDAPSGRGVLPPSGAKYFPLESHGRDASLVASVVQLLYATEPLRERVLLAAVCVRGWGAPGTVARRLAAPPTAPDRDDEELTPLDELYELLLTMHAQPQRTGPPLSLDPFLAAVARAPPPLAVFAAVGTPAAAADAAHELDVWEFWQALMADVHRSAAARGLVEPRSAADPPAAASEKARPSRTPFRALFGAVLETETQCSNCGHVVSELSKSWGLSVPVDGGGGGGGGRSLPFLLRQTYGRPVEHAGEGQRLMCSMCDSEQDSTRRVRVARVPPVVAVHLDRRRRDGAGAGLQDARRVHVPLELKLDAASLSGAASARDGERVLELYGAVVRTDGYRGVPNSGLHVAVARIGDAWVQFSDVGVSVVDHDDVVASFGAFLDPLRRSRALCLAVYR